MPTFLPRAIMYALVATGVTSVTSAISLSNFTPRIENLPSQCQAVYTREIQGCQAGDFTTEGQLCSAACVQGLVDIMKQVGDACATVDVPELSIIGVFLAGAGIPALCPGIQVTTVAPSSTQAAAPPKQESSAPATQTQLTTTAETPQASSSAGSVTSSIASSSSGIGIDTTVPTTLATSLPPPSFAPPTETVQQPQASTSAAAQADSTASSQKSNADSGGGSPFDVVATGSSSSLIPPPRLTIGAILGAIALACAMI